jgi:cytochrome c6
MSLPLTATVLTAVLFIATSTSKAQNTGASSYTAKCQMCHGATGLGDTPAGKAMGARPFNSPDVMKESDADLITVIKNGKAKMPAFAGKLTDAEISALVVHIHSLQK